MFQFATSESLLILTWFSAKCKHPTLAHVSRAAQRCSSHGDQPMWWNTRISLSSSFKHQSVGLKCCRQAVYFKGLLLVSVFVCYRGQKILIFSHFFLFFYWTDRFVGSQPESLVPSVESLLFTPPIVLSTFPTYCILPISDGVKYCLLYLHRKSTISPCDYFQGIEQPRGERSEDVPVCPYVLGKKDSSDWFIDSGLLQESCD